MLPAPDGARTLTEALRQLDAADVTPEDVTLRKPTLDEVFLAFTGHLATQTGNRPNPRGGADRHGQQQPEGQPDERHHNHPHRPRLADPRGQRRCGHHPAQPAAHLRLPEVLVLSASMPVIFILMFTYVFGGAIQGTSHRPPPATTSTG